MSLSAAKNPVADDTLVRVLGIDPALRTTGYSVIDWTRDGMRCMTFGTISPPKRAPVSSCLLHLCQELRALVTQYQPTECAIEATIYVQSLKTAIVLGAARGACLIAAAEQNVPIFEYSPREIKQGAVGSGAAAKAQVAFMVRSILRLRETPPPDAADALAVAITHLQSRQSATSAGQQIRRI